MTTSCKHRRTWVIAGGYYEWCYECGAIRGLHVSATGNSVRPRTYWERPVGAGGENPAVRYAEASDKRGLLKQLKAVA